MLDLCNTDVGLNSLFIAFQMKAFLLAYALEITVQHGGHFKLSRTYGRGSAKEQMGWSFRKPTSNASKIPSDWME